ncbi:MAG: hypothetical protein GY884_18560 [Proteobacteria bacterium]|nr:hypothetical protein [Pseudomonadota bacterium]
MLRGHEKSDYFGAAVTLGDIDGDSTPDLVASAREGAGSGGTADHGGAYVFLGPLSGHLGASDADFMLSETVEDDLGWDVTMPGDLDGDGLDDLAISNREESDGLGTVYLFLGPLTGSVDTTQASATLEGTRGLGFFGTRVEAHGDQDGDGTAEFLVAEPWASSSEGAADYRGAVHVFSGTDTTAVATILSETDHGYAGSGLEGSGDLDGDGVNDVVIGNPSLDSTWIVFGPVTADVVESDVDLTLTGPSGSDAGGAVEALGDQNGDGYDDLAIGTPAALSGKGSVYVLNGPITGDASLAVSRDAVLTGATSGSAGDVFVGASENSTATGAAYLLLGGVGL